MGYFAPSAIVRYSGNRPAASANSRRATAAVAERKKSVASPRSRAAQQITSVRPTASHASLGSARSGERSTCRRKSWTAAAKQSPAEGCRSSSNAENCPMRYCWVIGSSEMNHIAYAARRGRQWPLKSLAETASRRRVVQAHARARRALPGQATSEDVDAGLAISPGSASLAAHVFACASIIARISASPMACVGAVRRTQRSVSRSKAHGTSSREFARTCCCARSRSAVASLRLSG